jgi:hypothetical protein
MPHKYDGRWRAEVQVALAVILRRKMQFRPTKDLPSARAPLVGWSTVSPDGPCRGTPPDQPSH